MHYLIDGYNLMHAAGLMKPRFGPGGLERARRALVGALAGSLGEDAKLTTIVFDARVCPRPAEGDTGSTATHGITLEFAVGEESADARIETLIRQASAPKQLTVVSSDARIRTAARRRGAKSVKSGAFWEQLVERRRTRKPAGPAAPAAASEKPAGRATRDREYWLHEFEGLVSDADLRELAGPFADLD